MTRVASSAILGLLFVGSAWAIAHPSRTLAQATACAKFSVGRCYYPRQVRQAERSAHFRPVNPSAAVAKVSGLPLYRINVDPIAGPNQRTIPGGRLTYVYSRIALPPMDVRFFPRKEPSFVVVEETLGNDNFAKQVTLSRVYTPKWHAYGPWWFVAVGRIPNVALQVFSNLSKAMVRGIGESILAASSRTTLNVTPHCFVYGHPTDAHIVLTGAHPYQWIEFVWAVRNAVSTGMGLGTTSRAGASGEVHASFLAPTEYQGDVAQWVLSAFDLRGRRLVDSFFRVAHASCH